MNNEQSATANLHSFASNKDELVCYVNLSKSLIKTLLTKHVNGVAVKKVDKDLMIDLLYKTQERVRSFANRIVR